MNSTIVRSLLRLAIVSVSGLAGVSLPAQTHTASAVLHSQSIDLFPSSPAPAAGSSSVTTYFSTYNGVYGDFLNDPNNGGLISGELRPRSGSPGVYEGAYAFVSSGTQIDYGSFTTSVPTTDADGNGVPDVLQYNYAGSFTGTGTGQSASLGGPSFNVSLQLTRAANSETGTYTLTTSVTGGLTNVATGTFSLVTYQGSVTYTRGTTNSMTLSVTGVVAGGNTLTGTTTYTTSGTDQLSYAAFTLTSSSGDTFSVLPGTLTRSGTTYKGALNLVDGLDETYWPDYTAYAFQITDPNDTNGNGIPDLTDSPAATTAPFINASPQGHTMSAGDSVVFGVTATGGTLSYQWSKDGLAIPGATLPQLLVSNVQAANAGNYTVAVTNNIGTTTSQAATLSVVAATNPGRLINASVRIVSGTGANLLFVGFVTGGTGTSGSKQLLIRAVGPTLANFGVPGVMLDPLLDIIPSGATVPLLTNDNWNGDPTVTSVGNAVGAFALPSTTSKDAALVATLPGGVYSARVSGVNSTTGTVLAEIYDANPAVYSSTTPRLINLSARAAMTNDNPLIAGFVVGGSTAKTLLIRAIGPTLTNYGVTGAMTDPQLQLYAQQSGTNTLLLSNDNWGGSSLLATVSGNVGAFALPDPTSKDAVLLVTLDPGVYSAEVLGVGGASGIALVELYEVP